MRRPPSGAYCGEFATQYGRDSTSVRFVATGEYRNPRKGEYYLSGAIVTAYLASNNLSSPYWIARHVILETCPHCKGTGKVVKP